MSRRPSKHYSVATSITDIHRLSPYTVYHEIRKSWVMGPGTAVNAVGFLHYQETIARPLGGFRGWGGGGGSSGARRLLPLLPGHDQALLCSSFPFTRT